MSSGRSYLCFGYLCYLCFGYLCYCYCYPSFYRDYRDCYCDYRDYLLGFLRRLS